MDEARWVRIERTIEYLTSQQTTMRELAQAQRHTDERLNALIRFVDRKLGGTPLN